MLNKEKLFFMADGRKYKYEGFLTNKKKDFYSFVIKQKYDIPKILLVYKQNFEDNEDENNIINEYNNYCEIKNKKQESEPNDNFYSYTKSEYDEIYKFINFVVSDKTPELKPEPTVENSKFTIYLSIENINQHNIIICNDNITYKELHEKIKQKIDKNFILYFKDDEHKIILNDNDSLEAFKNIDGKKKLYYSFDEPIKFNNYNNKKTYNYKKLDNNLIFCKFDNSEENMLMCWENNDIVVSNINTGKYMWQEKMASMITSCDYSKDLILLTSHSGNIRIFDVKTLKFISKFKINKEIVYFCKYNIQRDKFLLSTMENRVIICCAENNSEMHNTQNSSIACYSKFIDESNYLSGFMSGLITINDIRCKNQAKCVDGHNSKINYLDYDVSNQNIISCSSNGEIKLWDARNLYSCLDQIKLCDSSIRTVNFFENKYLVLCNESIIKFYDIQNKSIVHELLGHEEYIIDIHLFDKKILSASQDGTIKLWSMCNQSL